MARWALTGQMQAKVALPSRRMKLSVPMLPAPPGRCEPARTTTPISIPRYRSHRRSSPEPNGSGRQCAVQDSGQDGYVGIYSWNNGSPELLLFGRTGGTWDQIGAAFMCGALPAGTSLRLMVVGSTLSFLENGVERIAGYDPTYTGGDPGIMVNGNGHVGSWSGGTAGFEVHYLSSDANGVQSYDMISANNGYGPQVLRVLSPTDPAPGVPHNFIYTLPVAPGADNSTYGDGLDTLESLNAQNQYNLTIIEPSFGISPWYADNPLDPNEQEETFMTTELVPWVKANLSTTGTEQNWLIGFSKSGLGGTDLLLKHPNLFTLGAFWDFPADMSSYDAVGGDPEASYGTDASFQANYRLTQAFVDAHKTAFLISNRIWLGGYSIFGTDITDFDALLTAEQIPHTLGPMEDAVHSWTSGWVPGALAALAQDSVNFTGSGGDTTPPSVPSGLAATSVGQNSIDLSWQPSSDNVGVAGYQVYRNGVPLATSPGTSYVDATVAPGSSYEYAVAAFDTAGNVSAQSTPVTVSVAQISQSISFATQAPGTVGGSAILSATGGASGNPVVFSVDASSGAGVCNVSGTNGTNVNYAAVGSCVIDANQSGGANYSAAAQAQMTITVKPPANQAPAITSAASTTATVGTSFSFTVTATGYPTPTLTRERRHPAHWRQLHRKRQRHCHHLGDAHQERLLHRDHHRLQRGEPQGDPEPGHHRQPGPGHNQCRQRHRYGGHCI